MLRSFGRSLMLSLGMRTSLIFNTQHVATGWPNACSMLSPTMLRYVALKCCDRLAGALASNEMLGQQCWDMLCWNIVIVWPGLKNWPWPVKPRPNDRNISTQHITTLLGATCYARFATLLWHVGTCWVLKIELRRMPGCNIVAGTWPNDYNIM